MTPTAALPGVTVTVASPALIERTRTAVTDGTGNYQIISLRPGTYSVTFSLDGFNTVLREGVVLSGAFTAPVDATLPVGDRNEEVTVTTEAPLVDVVSTRQQTVHDGRSDQRRCHRRRASIGPGSMCRGRNSSSVWRPFTGRTRWIASRPTTV